MKKLLLFVATIYFGSHSSACLRVVSFPLTANEFIDGEGIHSREDGSLHTCQDIGVNNEATISRAGKVSHEVKVLGCYFDEQGTISATYLIKDILKGEEKKVKISSSYLGDGVYSKGECGKVDVLANRKLDDTAQNVSREELPENVSNFIDTSGMAQ